jgi:hypothetical protein
VTEIVIALPGGEGLIRSDDPRFDYCLTSDVKRGGGQPIAYQDRYEPGRIDLGDERRLVGGLLPPGAVSAEVIDDRGTRVVAVVNGGAYVAVLDASDWRLDPPVCCRDQDGKPVRRPWAGDYPSERVTDSQEPCPACGSVDWDEYRPFEDWRGGSGSKVDGTNVPNPVVSCRVCGHQEREGSFFSMTSAEPENEDENAKAERMALARAQHARRRWVQAEPLLRTAAFPIYGISGRTGQLGGQSWSEHTLTAATIEYFESPDDNRIDGSFPDLVITTSHDPHRAGALEQARDAIEPWNLAKGESWPEGSNAARTLWLRARSREQRSRALNTHPIEQTILIDRRPANTTTLNRPNGGWATVVEHGDVSVVISARKGLPENLSLEPILHPVTELLGPEPREA